MSRFFSINSQRQATLLLVVLAVSLIAGVVILTKPKAATPTRVWKVLPWGDSNTEGGTPPDGSCDINRGAYSYRGHLYNKLVADGYALDYIGPLKLNGCTGMTEDIPDLDHAGYGAFSISDPGGGDCGVRSPGVCGYGLLENIDPMQVKDADIILLMIGYNGQGPASALETLINATMAANPNAKLFTGGYPPPAGGGLQELRDKSKEMADKSATDNLYWVDFNNTTIGGGDFIGDGIHHSPQGAAKVADSFYEAIIASGVLGSPGTGSTPTPSPTDTPTPTASPSITEAPTPSPSPTQSPTATPTPNEDVAKYDIQPNGLIDAADLSIVIRDYTRPGQTPVTNSPADFDANGKVDLLDLSNLIKRWDLHV